jgi:hypothetical protein
MKAKILILALALFGTTVAFSQNVQHEKQTDCEKKVLKKIQRTMRLMQVKEILDEGEKSLVIVTCFINENNIVEVARIDGANEEIKTAVLETLESYPVKCKMGADGNYFTFKMRFEHWPA